MIIGKLCFSLYSKAMPWGKELNVSKNEKSQAFKICSLRKSIFPLALAHLPVHFPVLDVVYLYQLIYLSTLPIPFFSNFLGVGWRREAGNQEICCIIRISGFFISLHPFLSASQEGFCCARASCKSGQTAAKTLASSISGEVELWWGPLHANDIIATSSSFPIILYSPEVIKNVQKTACIFCCNFGRNCFFVLSLF